MTIKEAILKSLEEINNLATHSDVYNNIIKNRYCNFDGKTPERTVSALLGDFIRNNDSRIKRVKGNGNYYLYYLAKYEQNINFDDFIKSIDKVAKKEIKTKKTYQERDLHKLLST